MSTEEKAALEWLDECADSCRGTWAVARTIKAMLAQPRLPEEPSEDVIEVLMDRGEVTRSTGERRYRKLYAHLTKPKTKTVEVWRVEFAYPKGDGWGTSAQTCDTFQEADNFSRFQLTKGFHDCIRVTGPHKQEVPA